MAEKIEYLKNPNGKIDNRITFEEYDIDNEIADCRTNETECLNTAQYWHEKAASLENAKITAKNK
jgi:hypothetical protein